MFERFTDQARRVVVYAQEESRLLNHKHIGTEHLLLGVLSGDGDDTVRALQTAGATSDAVRHRLVELRGRGRKETRGHIPFTPRAKQALEEAFRASQRLGQSYIVPAHLLRGLLEVPESLAYRLLVERGVDIAALAVAADELASAEDTASVSAAVTHVRTVHSATHSGTPPQARRMSADEIAAQIGRLAGIVADDRNALARGLRRYGRHDDGCDAARGCTCGLDELLEIAEPRQDQQP